MNRQNRRQAARSVKGGRRGNGATSPANAALLQEALKLQRAGDPRKALQLYRKVLAVQPNQVDALNLGGVASLALNHIGEAVKLLQAAVRLLPNYAEANNNLGSALQAANRLDEAAANYRRAAEIKPDYAEAHCNLGMILQIQRKNGDAIPCFLRAIKIDSRHPTAFDALGIALVAVGRTEEGVVAYRQAICLDPTRSLTHGNLGIALVALGRVEDGIASYRQALALDASHAETHNNLGIALVMLGRVDEGMVSYRQALALDPNNANVHCNLGSAFKNKGLFDEADLHFEKAMAADAGLSGAYKNSITTRKIESGDPIIGRIERLLHQRDLPDEDRSNCHFALGKCFDDLKQYDKAFEHYRIANDLKKSLISPFDTIRHTQELDRVIAVFSEAFFDHGTLMGSESERPVFIVGMPRSGTSLVEQIIASHPNAFGGGELRSMSQILRGLTSGSGAAKLYPECVSDLDHATAMDLATSYLLDLENISAEALRVTDKMPANFLNLGMISALFPRARIIHCRRGPMDVCLSCYFQDFIGSLPYTYDQVDLGRYYREYERLMAHWNAILPTPILEVRYEDLVADKDRVTREILAYCGLEWNDACLAFHDTDRTVRTASEWQVRQPIYKTSVERWRRYETHLGPLKAALGDAH